MLEVTHSYSYLQKSPDLPEAAEGLLLSPEALPLPARSPLPPFSLSSPNIFPNILLIFAL